MPAARTDRSLLALIAGFAIIVGLVAGAILVSRAQQAAFAGVAETLDVENRLRIVLSDLQDAETGQRGYLLSGEESFLQPYEAALGRIDTSLAGLAASVADVPELSERMRRLRELSDARADVLARSVTLYRATGPSAISVERLARGKVLMDDIRAVIAEMVAFQERRLADRRANAARLTGQLTIGLVIAALAAIALAAFALRDIRRRLRVALAAGVEIERVNERLLAEAASREDAEARVRQMQKTEAIGQLTGGIAHDFNNMLAIIIGSLDMAKRRLDAQPDRVQGCIDNAMEGAQRAAQLTGRLLAFSRQQPLAPTVVDLNKLVGGMSEMLRRTIGDQIRVETILAGGLWRICADVPQLENAVVNLAVNARDAMPEGGRLTIETANAHLDEAYSAQHSEVTAGQYAMLSITDTGTGMPPEVIEKAFDPFYTTKGPGKGTGLGLSQVHGFLKQSDGHVKIYSEAGVGTTIKLYVPRYYGDEQATEQKARAIEALPRGHEDEIVLVVEDEDRVRHMSVDALRELGYTVVQASDANQALAVLSMQPRIDLMFTDIVMPDMNGRKLADLARKERPALKVLYTTGYTRNAIVHNGILDHGVAFLAKPFTLEQLAVKVRGMIDTPGEGEA